MENNIDHVKLVKEAQLGDKQCLEQLSKAARQRLRVDIYRLTLEADLTQELVQETILEMLKVLDELKEADRFWPWLYKIALNKLRLHHRRLKHRKTVPISSIPEPYEQDKGQDAISNAVAKELMQAVRSALPFVIKSLLTFPCTVRWISWLVCDLL